MLCIWDDIYLDLKCSLSGGGVFSVYPPVDHTIDKDTLHSLTITTHNAPIVNGK